MDGGEGGDKYIWKAGSDVDLIDNTGGGTDWLFFNGVDRSRLGYHRDGDDLVITVDGDSGQGVRVKDHFLGGDMAIDYIQPGSGYAIPAAQIAGLLTPMPGTGTQNLSTMTARVDSLAAEPDRLREVSRAASVSSGSDAPWREGMDGSAWSLWRDGRVTSHEPMPVRLETARESQVMPDLQRLIEAMASFNPSSGAVLEMGDADPPMGVSTGSSLALERRQPWEQQMHDFMQ